MRGLCIYKKRSGGYKRLVSQEQKAMDRIQSMLNYIKENQPVNETMIESYMMFHFGVRPRTVALYMKSVANLKLISWTGEKFNKLFSVVETEEKKEENQQ